jgi:hypothetical protein
MFKFLKNMLKSLSNDKDTQPNNYISQIKNSIIFKDFDEHSVNFKYGGVCFTSNPLYFFERNSIDKTITNIKIDKLNLDFNISYTDTIGKSRKYIVDMILTPMFKKCLLNEFDPHDIFDINYIKTYNNLDKLVPQNLQSVFPYQP